VRWTGGARFMHLHGIIDFFCHSYWLSLLSRR
jgi:hypothetical protein